MANTVEIVITVDNRQANAALYETTNALHQAGVQGGLSMRDLQSATEVADKGIGNVSRATREMGGHMSSSLDGVRLLSQEFGLRLPRALESMVSRMPAVTTAIQGMMGAFAGIAIAEVLFRAGDAVYNLYNKYISLNAAAKAYHDEVEKRKDEEFVNTHSIEVTRDRIKEATDAAKNFQQLGQDIHDGAWKDIFSFDPQRVAQGLGALYNARQLADAGYKYQTQADTLQQRSPGQQHDLDVLKIDKAHAGDSATLNKQKQINQEYEKSIALIQSEYAYKNKLDGLPDGAPKGEEQVLREQAAASERDAKMIALRRDTSNKTIQLQNEATNAGLRGNELLFAQMDQAKKELLRSANATQAELEAIERRYRTEFKRGLEEETRAVQDRARAEQEASLGTVARLRATGEDAQRKINTKESDGLYKDQTAPGQHSALADQDRVTAAQQTNREILDAQVKFDQEQEQSVDRASAHQIAAFAKVEQSVAEGVQKRADAFNLMYGNLALNDALYQQGQAALERQNADAYETAERQKQQIRQEVQQQTLQMDRETAATEARGRSEGMLGWVAKYQETTAKIKAEHDALLEKINDAQAKTGSDPTTDSLYERQKVDADRRANAEIAEANQQLAQSISGMLADAFDTPAKDIPRKMRSMMLHIIADWLSQSRGFQQTFGGILTPGGGPGGHGPLGKLGGGSYGGSVIGGLTNRLGITHAPVRQTSGLPQTPVLGGSPSSSGSLAPASATQPAAIQGANSTPDYSTNYGSPSTGMYGFSGSSTTVSPASFPSISTAASGSQPSVTGAISGVSSLATTVGAGYTALTQGGSSSGMATPTTQSNGTDTAQGMPDDDALASGGYITGVAKAGSSSASATAPAQSALSYGAGAGGGVAALTGLVGAGVGAYQGFNGVVSGFESGNAGGILTGATGGAELGGSIGMLAGPLGGAIGAGVGAAVGAAAGIIGDVTGEGGRLGGAKYYKQTVEPQLIATEAAYLGGNGGSSSSTLSSLNEIAAQGQRAILQQFGGDVASWVQQQYTSKELQFLSGQVNRFAVGGADYLQKSAVQFHTGGTIGGFGDLWTSSNEGYVHAMLGEKITNTAASSTHAPYIDAMNSGASEADVAGMYLRNMGAGSAGGGDTHHHYYEGDDIDAVDAASFSQLLEQRGGDAAVSRALNKYSLGYGGEAA